MACSQKVNHDRAAIETRTPFYKNIYSLNLIPIGSKLSLDMKQQIILNALIQTYSKLRLKFFVRLGPGLDDFRRPSYGKLHSEISKPGSKVDQTKCQKSVTVKIRRLLRKFDQN